MKYRIIEIEKTRIAFFRSTGAYGEENYKAMKRIKDFAAENEIFDEAHDILGIAQDNPQTTPPESCRYDACVTVTEGFASDDENILSGFAFGGKYAVFEAEHTKEGVSKAWKEIFSSGLPIDYSRRIVERYRLSLVNDGKCEICVPLQ